MSIHKWKVVKIWEIDDNPYHSPILQFILSHTLALASTSGGTTSNSSGFSWNRVVGLTVPRPFWIHSCLICEITNVHPNGNKAAHTAECHNIKWNLLKQLYHFVFNEDVNYRGLNDHLGPWVYFCFFFCPPTLSSTSSLSVTSFWGSLASKKNVTFSSSLPFHCPWKTGPVLCPPLYLGEGSRGRGFFPPAEPYVSRIWMHGRVRRQHWNDIEAANIWRDLPACVRHYVGKIKKKLWHL